MCSQQRSAGLSSEGSDQVQLGKWGGKTKQHIDNLEIKIFLLPIFKKSGLWREGTVLRTQILLFNKWWSCTALNIFPSEFPIYIYIYIFLSGFTKSSQTLLEVFPDKADLHFWSLSLWG